MKFDKDDAFCEVYGFTLNNLVWGYLLENNSVGAAVGDMAKELGMSRPKAYQIIEEFMKKGYIVKDRVIGRTQLYILNKNNPVVKIFTRNFNECINMVIEEHTSKKNNNAPLRVPVSVKAI